MLINDQKFKYYQKFYKPSSSPVASNNSTWASEFCNVMATNLYLMNEEDQTNKKDR